MDAFGRFWTFLEVLDALGRFWAYLNIFGRFWTFLDISIWTFLEGFWTLLDFFGHILLVIRLQIGTIWAFFLEFIMRWI